MCYAAKHNGMKAASNENCNVQRDQRCCGGGDGLKAQQDYASKTHYTFVANERDMYQAMDVEHYRYVVQLRNSQDRYRSHYRHMLREAAENHNLRTVSAAETFEKWWQKQPDNWNVRKICGTACMNVPKFQITKDLFHYTVNRLKNFDDILFVENFNQSFTKFAHRVGWTKMPTHEPSSHHKFASTIDMKDMWDPMMSVLDDALYELAVEMYKGTPDPTLSHDTLATVQGYFARGPLRGCNYPCCFEQCSSY
jgi:hypothetical protein